MSDRKGKGGRAAETLSKAEEVAASVDEPTKRAVGDQIIGTEDPETAVVDALDSAAMVAEGGQVAAATNGIEPESDPEPVDDGASDTSEEAAVHLDTMEDEGGPASGTAAPEELPAEPQIAAGPIADPPQPGPGNPSPDGSTLAFLQEDSAGETRLWLYAIDASGGWSMGLPFHPVIDDDGPQWSPDGKWIALTGSRYRGGPTSIWLAPVDGGDCVLLADHRASDRQPRWSPDGTLLAFVTNRDGRDAICIALPGGQGPVIQLTWAGAGQDDREPTWSEDSSRIAFLRRFVEAESTGDHVWTVSLATGEIKQSTKKVANRHSLRWSPGKSQVGFITDEGEWQNVGVVNPDNSAGWNLASEAGDKGDPRYSPDGSRMLYTRALRGEVRLGERATSGASAELLDPGMGVVSAPRWLPEKRVVYRFAPATGSPHFIVQNAKKDAERTILPAAVEWQAGRPLIAPAHIEFETPSGTKLGGLLYRDPQIEGKTPGILVVDDQPWLRNDASFRPVEQALAAAGFAVLTPTLPGSPGLGKKVAAVTRDTGPADAEIIDIEDAMQALRELDSVDESRVGVVGLGYGGAVALVLAGTRPAGLEAVVAIDPVVDWDDEFDHGTSEWRAWQVKQHGLPVSSRGRHSLRTPTTFIGVVEAPLMLLGTSRASSGRAAQLGMLLSVIEELGLSVEHQSALGESTWATTERAATFLRDRLGPNLPPEEPPAEPPAEAEAERADEI